MVGIIERDKLPGTKGLITQVKRVGSSRWATVVLTYMSAPRLVDCYCIRDYELMMDISASSLGQQLHQNATFVKAGVLSTSICHV
jgi:hypothetical protein